MNRRLLRSALSGLLLAACSSTTEPPSGSGGAGGEGGEGGGEEGGGGDGGSGGGAPRACGGSAGAACGETEYCALHDAAADACGSGAEGECAPRPAPNDCPVDCPGVCGCDHRIYCNECLARAAGVNASKDTTCTSAVYVIGGNDHVHVRSVDLEARRCIALHMASPGENDPLFAGIDIQEFWGVWDIRITDEMDRCGGTGLGGVEQIQAVTGATGSITWEAEPGTGIPCVLDIDVDLTLEGEPATDSIRATGVSVHNTCL